MRMMDEDSANEKAKLDKGFEVCPFCQRKPFIMLVVDRSTGGCMALIRCTYCDVIAVTKQYFAQDEVDYSLAKRAWGHKARSLEWLVKVATPEPISEVRMERFLAMHRSKW